jgi:hypothetical protein
MKLLGFSILLSCGAALVVRAPAKDSPDSAALQDFTRRVSDYVKVHQLARSEVHGLKPTNSPEAIEHYEHRLAHRIREMRPGDGQGEIFAPEISAEFRRLIGITLQGPEGQRILKSIWDSKPARLPVIRVNSMYPSGVPLQSTPPSLLLNLPSLPPQVEYRVIGHALVLRDVDANLIVDLIPNAIP